MSLRRRAMLLIGGVVGAALAGVGLYVGASVERWATEALDHELADHADALIAGLEVEHGEVELEASIGEFVVRDARGRELARRGLAGVPVPERAGSVDVVDRAGRPYRLSTRAPAGPARVWITVGVPTDRAVELARRVRFGLAVAIGLGALSAALLAGWAAARLARPIERLAREVQEITPDRLDRRLRTDDLDPELRPLAERMNESLDRLEPAFAAQRALVARASHALRTPIASMLAVAEVSERRERAPAEHRAALAEIAELARDAARRVDELLALGRAEAAGGERAPVALAPLIDEVARVFRDRLEARQLALVVDVPAELTALGDRASLRELVDVVLDNAVRYSPPPAGASDRDEERAIVVRGEGRGDAVVLTFTDSGPGFDPTERERVFERFVRGRAGATSGEPGSGLGLSIARAVARAHGGEVEVVDSPGPGATVAVRLPAAQRR